MQLKWQNFSSILVRLVYTSILSRYYFSLQRKNIFVKVAKMDVMFLVPLLAQMYCNITILHT